MQKMWCKDGRKKPICSNCSTEMHKRRTDKIVRIQITRECKELKKVFVCPICDGMYANKYTTDTKGKLKQHMKDIHYTELVNIGTYNE